MVRRCPVGFVLGRSDFESKAETGGGGKTGEGRCRTHFRLLGRSCKGLEPLAVWVNSKLHTAFPYAKRHRKFVHERLKIIQRLRNRIAHHEPVLTSRNTLDRKRFADPKSLD